MPQPARAISRTSAARDPLGNELLLEYDVSGRLVRSRGPGRDVDTPSTAGWPNSSTATAR
ncbi:hypothetical protein ACFVW8_28480 [Streptomyces sp. NPDC058221]|uniref:hypothetical protein n=1 Tax=Streptomyces sp. NPDC058221 TaxID=3346388 RepID=UPI0036E0B72C